MAPLGGGVSEGSNQPAWFNLSPVTWDYLRTWQQLSCVRHRLHGIHPFDANLILMVN
jgi:hypothetical protein